MWAFLQFWCFDAVDYQTEINHSITHHNNALIDHNNNKNHIHNRAMLSPSPWTMYFTQGIRALGKYGLSRRPFAFCFGELPC